MKRIILSIVAIIWIGTLSFSHAGELNIAVTGNNRGLLTPCGCKIPSGGWARISTAVRSIDEPKLLIGAGNHFFHHTPMPKEDQIFEQKKAAFQAKMFHELEFNVVNIGQFDLCYGLKVLKSMQQTYSLPFISANILDMSDSPAFPAYKIIEHDGSSIMFVGLCYLSDGFNYKIADPLQTLTKMHEDGLFEKADLVILLADAPAKILSEFVKEFNGIDIIIASKEHTFTSLPVHYKQTALIQMGSQGKYMGIIDVHLSDTKQEFSDISPSRFKVKALQSPISDNIGSKNKANHQLKKARKQLKRFEKENLPYYGLDMIFLDESVKDDPEIKAQVEEFVKYP